MTEKSNGYYLELAYRIKTWAESSNLSENRILLHLVESLESNRLGHLSLIKSIENFWPKPSSNAGSSLIRLSQIIGIIRNAIIFVPVALTWKAVSEATYGFAKFTTTNKGVPVNFLTFWQTGYGYINEFWRIGHVAELDFLLILGVILLTLTSTFMFRSGIRQKNLATSSLQEEGDLILFELCQLVSPKNSVLASSLDKIAKDAITTIHISIRESNEILSELKLYQNSIASSMKEVRDFSNSLELSSQNQQTILESLMKLFVNLEEVTDLKAKNLETKRVIKSLLANIESK